MGFIAKMFEVIGGFFSYIFFPNSPRTVNRKKLKQIYAKLKRLEHPLITKDLFVLPDFAKVLFSIYGEVLPVKSVFEQTIMNPDVRIANKFVDLLIEESFSARQRAEFQLFSYEAREAELQREAASSIEVIQRRLKDQSKRFHSFLHSLRTPEVVSAEQTIQNIYALYDFCCFDFYSFFSHFADLTKEELDAMVQEGSFPPFHRVIISDIMKDLLDLNFLLKNLNIDDDLMSSIEVMCKLPLKVNENKFLFILQRIAAINDTIEKQWPDNAVLDMIRYAKNDPDFVEATEAKVPNIIAEFMERLEGRFSADLKKLLLVFQESKIDKLVYDAFGDRKFFSFAGYNAEINEHLQKSTSLTFDWIRPMELIRTFTKQNFDTNMKLLLKTILVEGFFIDNAYQQSLGAAFYYCENLSDKFEEFERLFTAGEKCNLAEIRGLLTEIDNGANFEKQLSKIVETANVTAKGIVQTAVEKYTLLYTTCVQLIADSKKHNAELISNIKVLYNSGKLKSLVPIFERDVQTLNKFLEIMKNYAILVRIDVS